MCSYRPWWWWMASSRSCSSEGRSTSPHALHHVSTLPMYCGGTNTHTLTQTDARRWSISQETRREAGEVFASVCSSLALRPRRTRTRPRSSLDNIAKLQDAETSLCVSSVRGVMNNSDCRSFSGLQWEVRKTKQSTRKRCNYSLLDVSPVMIRRGYTSRTKIQSAPLATCGG